MSRIPAEPPVTVGSALRLPALRRGAPEVLAGAHRLGRPIRWAHSCEARHVPELLEGDEMLLMTGMGLGTAAADQRAFVRDLVERRVAGLVIELGRVFERMPEPLVHEARRQHLPLIALHEEVRFVEVTKQLHTAILTRQLTVERHVTDLHARLSALVLDGAGMPAIIGDLARAIGNPVLLERAGGEVIRTRGSWASRSRAAASGARCATCARHCGGGGSGACSARGRAGRRRHAPVRAAGGRAGGGGRARRGGGGRRRARGGR